MGTKEGTTGEHMDTRDTSCARTANAAKQRFSHNEKILVSFGVIWFKLLCAPCGVDQLGLENFLQVFAEPVTRLQDEQDRKALRPPHGYPGVAPQSSPSTSPSRTSPPRSAAADWELCEGRGSDEPKTAKIIRQFLMVTHVFGTMEI